MKLSEFKAKSSGVVRSLGGKIIIDSPMKIMMLNI